MAQLSDDCFSSGDGFYRLDEAIALLTERLDCVVGKETVPLRGACGRTLAENVTACRNVPPYDNSAVDGYAVYFEDLIPDAETELPVIGRVAAGHPLQQVAERGAAVRIFTGAPMSEGPDTVMMQEDCVEKDGRVSIKPGIKKGANRRSAGEDVTSGDVILRQGTRIGPAEIAIAAAQGLTGFEVFKPLRAAVLSTGDEVREPGEEIPEGAIFDANRHMVMAMLERLGCEVTDLGILPDTPDEIRRAIAAAAEQHDLLVSSGGMSVGEEDHLVGTIEDLGSLNFWRLAIKPGRPIGFGRIGDGRGRNVPIIGLPGNPVAAFTTLLMAGKPVIQRLGGREIQAVRHIRVAAAFDYKKKTGRREFMRGKLRRDEAGHPVSVTRYGASGAAILSSLTGADGFIDLDEDCSHVRKGDPVSVLLFDEVL